MFNRFITLEKKVMLRITKTNLFRISRQQHNISTTQRRSWMFADNFNLKFITQACALPGRPIYTLRTYAHTIQIGIVVVVIFFCIFLKVPFLYFGTCLKRRNSFIRNIVFAIIFCFLYGFSFHFFLRAIRVVVGLRFSFVWFLCVWKVIWDAHDIGCQTWTPFFSRDVI